MQKLSIKLKLTALCVGLLLMILLVAAIQLYGSSHISEALVDVTEVQMPAVHNMALADMVHDGTRAVIYNALYLADKGSAEEKQLVLADLKEMTENMTKYIDTIERLDVKPETRAAIAESRADIDTYMKKGAEVVDLALSNRKDQAVLKLAEFQSSFDALEKRFGVLGDLISVDAEQTSAAGLSFSKSSMNLSFAVVIIGIISGLIISWITIRDLTKTMDGVVTQLQKSSRELSSASADSASSSTKLSESSTEQAASLQETMASVEEISAMVSQNAESAVKVKQVVDLNQKATGDGSQNVNSMLKAVHEIKQTNEDILQQIESSNKEFGDIVKIISDIGEKTKVINDIVFQTKLLSFNASVEAARAGEHGKGFAVVAEEVGNLAQMSGNAAKEITDMLSGSIKKVNTIVEHTTQKVDQLVEAGKDKIAMGLSTAQSCKEALQVISSNAKEVADMVGDITHASKEQAQGIQEINKAIVQLDQLTQQNNNLSQASSAQSEKLNGEARSLSDSLAELIVFVYGGTQSKNKINS